MNAEIADGFANATEVLQALKKLADPERAKHSARYFKTGPGEYGEGDKFLGLTVPQTRTVARKFKNLEPAELYELVHNEWHEARLCALHILVDQFRRTKLEAGRQEIFEHYLRLLDDNVVNNWDLIDSSAPYLGAYLLGRSETTPLLFELSQSTSVWKRRASIIFTFALIRADVYEPSIKIAEQLIGDTHDLIHKATGWMLREVGNRNLTELRAFLTNHAAYMPRTMLRYAIEKLSAEERAEWLAKKAAAAKTI